MISFSFQHTAQVKERVWADSIRGEVDMAITLKVSRKKPHLKLEIWEWNLNVLHSHLFQACVIEKTGDKITSLPISIQYPSITCSNDP